eukprot:gene389-3735_t
MASTYNPEDSNNKQKLRQLYWQNATASLSNFSDEFSFTSKTLCNATIFTNLHATTYNPVLPHVHKDKCDCK